VKLVYVITRGDAVGGASIHVRDVAREMLARGHDVTVLVGGEGPVTEQFQTAGVPFRSLKHLRRSIHALKDLAAFRELESSLAELRPDLVSTHTSKAGWLGRAACRQLNIPVIYTPHGLTVGDRMGRLNGILFSKAERIAGRWTDAMVCVCEYERDLALANSLAARERLHVIHNGVRDIPDSLLANLQRAPKRIVSVARMEAPKDHATLLHAFAAVDPSWTLELIGDGPLEPAVREQARQLGIAARVHVRGYLSDPAEALSRAQLFVLSSRSEGFPRSILEAMRAGLPVIASDVGGVKESVSHGRSGILVKPSSVESLGEALVQLTNDLEMRQRMGAEGHQIQVSRFRFDAMIAKTAGLYEMLVNRNVVTV
jgi:glycosyltransferase involved in cell wall biosynthesis